MSKRPWIVYGVLGLAVALVALAFREIVIVALSAAVAAVVAIWVHRRLSKTDGGAESTAEQDEADVWIGHLQDLVRLDITIRENALPADTIARLEKSIDVLRNLLPELNDDYAGSELTWTVNRIATDYLHRIVDPYVALSPAGRAEHESELQKSLAGLEAELENIANLVRNAKVGEFQAKAAFLRARFLDGGDLG